MILMAATVHNLYLLYRPAPNRVVVTDPRRATTGYPNPALRP